MQTQSSELHARVVANGIAEAGRSAAHVPWIGGRARAFDRPWAYLAPAIAVAVMALHSMLG